MQFSWCVDYKKQFNVTGGKLDLVTGLFLNVFLNNMAHKILDRVNWDFNEQLQLQEFEKT